MFNLKKILIKNYLINNVHSRKLINKNVIRTTQKKFIQP